MKIKHQLSIATLLMAGVFVTGCSQQIAGGSQSQVEGASQVSGSQQQVEAAAPVVVAEPVAPKAPQPVRPTPQPKPIYKAPPVHKPVNRWAHTHPAVPRCTKSVRHTHKYNQARHSHKYSCQGQRPAPRMMKKDVMKPKEQVDVRALQLKLRAKGYYKGPIDGIVGPGTRSALQRFMKR